MQEYWNGLPVPSPGNLLDPVIKPGSAALQADSLLSAPQGKPKDHLGSPDANIILAFVIFITLLFLVTSPPMSILPYIIQIFPCF